jgi:hypothetical protein
VPALAPPPAKVRLVQLRLPALHPEQRQFVEDNTRIVVAACGTKTGKAAHLDSVVYTPSGPRLMRDIAIGDIVCTPTGRSTVTEIHPQGVTRLFDVTFCDGSTTRCDAEHLWRTNDQNGRDRLIATHDLMALTPGVLTGTYIPMTAPVEFDSQPLPIDPYVLGVILGDGCLRGNYTVGLSSEDDHILNRMRQGLGLDYVVRKKAGANCDYILVSANGQPNGLIRSLKALGLYGGYSSDKFVPNEYKITSVANRLELLRGILDTDGSVSKAGQPTLEQTSPKLAADVRWLVESLGGFVRQRDKVGSYVTATGTRKYCKTVYRQSIVVPDAASLFSLPRKVAQCRPKTKHVRRFFASITEVASAEAQCIKIADERGLYLTDQFIVTHNTFGLCIWLLQQAWNRPQSLNWWAAPTLRQSRIAFNTIGRWLPPLSSGRVRVNRNEMVYSLLKADGSVYSTIEFRSADNPDSLRGEGVHAAVIDEAGYWSQASFVSIWTTLTRTRGKLRIISTPKGRTWFWTEWMKGWDGKGCVESLRKKHPEYKSYQLSTESNPYIPRESIEEARNNLPDDVFRQEYMAEFLDESAGVFRNIRGCRVSEIIVKPVAGRRYVIGIDWAKHEDYTVMIVVDVLKKHVVHIERYKDIDWNVNVLRAIQNAKVWNNAVLIVDSTGVGDVPFDNIKAVYPSVIGYSIFNNAEKTALIQRLQFAFERGEIGIPNPPDQSRAEYRAVAEILDYELQTYGYKMSAQGKFIFSAPDSFHDDCVIALALANWLITEAPFTYRASQVPGV